MPPPPSAWKFLNQRGLSASSENANIKRIITEMITVMRTALCIIDVWRHQHRPQKLRTDRVSPWCSKHYGAGSHAFARMYWAHGNFWQTCDFESLSPSRTIHHMQSKQLLLCPSLWIRHRSSLQLLSKVLICSYSNVMHPTDFMGSSHPFCYFTLHYKSIMEAIQHDVLSRSTGM